MWLRTPKGMSSAEFSTHMLDTAGIVVPPGTAYGPGGEGFFRMSLCSSTERLQEAFDRMAKHSITYDMGKARV
jgi:LL-diaminopimelate aminotransferase